MTDDELIAKAKKDYPIGTVFYPAHIQENPEKKTISSNPDYRVKGRDLYVNVLEENSWLPILYYGNRSDWAKIISKPKQQDYEIY